MRLPSSQLVELWSVLRAQRARFIPMAIAVLVVVPFTELWKANHWSKAAFWAVLVPTLAVVLALRLAGPGTERWAGKAERGIVPRDAAK
jgi:hypothetical protein